MGAKVFFENGKPFKRKLMIDGNDLGEFKGHPQKDLSPGDTFEEMEGNKIVTRKIIDKVEIDGGLMVRSVVVGELNG